MDEDNELILCSNANVTIQIPANEVKQDPVVRAAGSFLDANPKKRNATNEAGAPLIYTINTTDSNRYWLQSIQYKDPVDSSLVWYVVMVQKIDCLEGYYTSHCDGVLYSDCACQSCKLSPEGTVQQNRWSPGGKVDQCEWCIAGTWWDTLAGRW